MCEICPNCGKPMAICSKEYIDRKDGSFIPEGVEYLLCSECGQITFTPDQVDKYLDALYGKGNLVSA